MLTLVQSFPSDFRVLNTERLASRASPSRHSVQVMSSLPDPGLWHHLDTEGRKEKIRLAVPKSAGTQERLSGGGTGVTQAEGPACGCRSFS